MIKKIKKKAVATMLLILTILSNLLPIVPMVQSLAVNNNDIGTTLDIISIGTIPYHLKSYGVASKGYVITHLVGYYDNGTFYPAFCMNKDRLGADDELSYDVTITEILGNTEMYNKVWRVVTNGYPYKSAGDLGVSDWVYAYQATKMAVYCVTGQANVDDFYATDTTGQEIVDLIHRLVDIGNNGSSTYRTPVSNINKSGDIFLDGNYYIQNYSLSANIDITNYDITITEFPTGTKITDANGTEKNTFNVGETFQVRLPKNSVETGDINGRIRATVTSKSYAMFYATAYNEALQDYTITGDPLALTSSSSNLNLKGNTGKIKINKTDDEINEAISGVKFQLLKADGTAVTTATTDNNGVANFSGLYQGNYILKEIETNKNYVLNSKQFDLNVKYNETTTVDITNEHKKGQIKVIKLDLDNNEVKLEGIEFKVYDENKNVVDTIVTDKEGTATTKKLRANQKYIVQETNTLQNYILNDKPQIVELKAEQITTLTFENELKKGQIRIIKVDKDFNEIKLKGVEFKIYNEENELVDTLVTNENGEATSKRLRIDKKYTIEETKTLQNYTLDETPQTITLKQDQITDVKFENEYKKGNLKIYKVDKDNHKIALGNVIFDLYSDEFQKVIGSYTTNVDGEIKIDNLRIGNYKLIEKNTGKWYNLADDTEIKIEWNKLKETTIENELQKGQVKVIKIDKDNHEVKLKGVKFDILDEKGNILETITTNEKGEAYTSRYAIRDCSKITIREKETLNEYVLNNKPETVVLQANQIKTITFENELKKGQIKIIKVDLDNNEVKLEGVKFEVKDENGNIVETLVTDKNGEATTKRLPITSKYTVVETETKKEYVLSNEAQTIKLKQDEIKNITFQNEKRKGKLRIIKVDKDNNEVLLEGVTFDIFDKNGKIVDTVVTDKNGEATTKRLPCVDEKYTAVEKETRKEYVLTKETKTIELKENEITSIQFENEKIKGYIEITKISKDDNKLTNVSKGTPLENVVFEIYKENNELVDTITTDKEGKAKSKLLEYGNYYVKEKDTGSDYYLLNTEKYGVEIKENMKTIPVTIENTSVEIGLDIDKTGIVQAQPNDEIKYSFNKLKNTSNVALDNFTWTDNLPYEYVRITKLFTGTYNEDLDYIVKYKTNKSEDYIEYGKYNTQKNNYIDFTKVELLDDEYITDYKVEFGTVMPGFEAIEKPFIFAKVLPTVKADDRWINHTTLTGNYKEHNLEDKAEWPTISYAKKLEIKKLPRNGF